VELRRSGEWVIKMPRTTKPPQVREANVSFSQMQEAITKIDRRLKDLAEFDVNAVNDRSDPRITALTKKLDTLLTSIFGADTVEYQRYRWAVTHLDTAPMYMGRSTSIEVIREGFRKGIATEAPNPPVMTLDEVLQ
jgi:hypothetical protein